ncbi:MAG: alpha/beta hydrolase [Acidimicrobiales bacterium]
MGNAVLITSDGDGHGAFLSNSECVTDVVFDYLINFRVPENGWNCQEP